MGSPLRGEKGESGLGIHTSYDTDTYQILVPILLRIVVTKHKTHGHRQLARIIAFTVVQVEAASSSLDISIGISGCEAHDLSRYLF